jgi:hypothetical protein
MHHATNDEPARRAAGQMQRRPLLEVEVLDEPALGEEVRGQLDRAAKARTDHGGADATIQAAKAPCGVDVAEAVDGVSIGVLRARRRKGTEALEARLDEEERTSGRGAQDARGGAAEDVDSEALLGRVAEQETGGVGAQRLVEAQPAAVENHLVDVGRAEAAIDGGRALVADNDGHAVEGASIHAPYLTGLELALELHADLDGLEGVRGGDGAAGGDAAGDKGTEPSV